MWPCVLFLTPHPQSLMSFPQWLTSLNTVHLADCQFTESLMFYFFGFCGGWVELLFFPDSQSCSALFSVIIAARLQITFRKITFQNKFSGLCKNRESCWEYGPDPCPCKWRFVKQYPHTLTPLFVSAFCCYVEKRYLPLSRAFPSWRPRKCGRAT